MITLDKILDKTLDKTLDKKIKHSSSKFPIILNNTSGIYEFLRVIRRSNVFTQFR